MEHLRGPDNTALMEPCVLFRMKMLPGVEVIRIIYFTMVYRWRCHHSCLTAFKVNTCLVSLAHIRLGCSTLEY